MRDGAGTLKEDGRGRKGIWEERYLRKEGEKSGWKGRLGIKRGGL